MIKSFYVSKSVEIILIIKRKALLLINHTKIFLKLFILQINIDFYGYLIIL